MKIKCLTVCCLLGALVASAYADVRTAVGDLQNALLWTDYFYVDSVSVDKLAESAIRGMLKELDPHSTYLTADEVKSMDENLGGTFEGIGVRYQMDRDTLLVISTVVGGPSEKVGIMAGDRIIAVGDSSIAGMKMGTREIQRRLRGPKGTIARLTVLRDGERIAFRVERDRIPVYSLDASYMASPEVGYIKVSRFSQTTDDELVKALDQLKEQGMKHLIIDLQGNGGGYLESAVQLCNHFLDYGNMVVYTEGRREQRKEHHASLRHPFEGRLVVMIDERSASSSEIFTGAMQDWDRAVIVGRRSFGKGLVQRPIKLPSGAMIRLTIAHYYTPSGRCIQKPFDPGKGDAYSQDLANRYKNGEYLSADSIHLVDSLRYTTHGGRTVYGGGGIMPDVFVPLDTTRLGKTHRDLIAKGTVNRYVLAFFSENQKALKRKYKTFEDFERGFQVTDAMMADLCSRGTADSVRIDSAEMASGSRLLRLQLKALVANDLFETGAYARIMNTQVDTYRTALDIISDPERYKAYLTKEGQAGAAAQKVKEGKTGKTKK